MMLDKEVLLSDKQDLSQAAGTYVSTNSIDLGTAGTIPGLGGTVLYDVGRGTPKRLWVQVTEDFTSGGAATLRVEIIESANADLSSPTVLAKTEDVALASLKAGYQFTLPGFIPQGITKRYLGVQYVIGTATTTAGTCSAGIAMDVQQNPSV